LSRYRHVVADDVQGFPVGDEVYSMVRFFSTIDIRADEFIDYTKTPPEGVAHDIDLVLDALGGPTTGRFLRTLKRGCTLFPVYPLGFSDAEKAKRRGIRVSAAQVRSKGAQLTEVAPLLVGRTIRVVLDSTYPLSTN